MKPPSKPPPPLPSRIDELQSILEHGGNVEILPSGEVRRVARPVDDAETITPKVLTRGVDLGGHY